MREGGRRPHRGVSAIEERCEGRSERETQVPQWACQRQWRNDPRGER